MVTVGILLAFVSDLGFAQIESWRAMFAVLAIPAFALLLGAFAVPNSPRWLAAKDRFDEARAVLSRLRGTSEEVNYEMGEIKDAIAQEQESEGWGLLRRNVNFRRSVALGVALQIIQQFTGMNVIMYYAPKIFQMSGFEGSSASMWATVITGLINVLATFIAIMLIDRIGRKPILYIGFSIMVAMMVMLGSVLAVGPSTVALKYTGMAAVLIFVAGFAMSAGPLIWTLCSEIQPIQGRDFGVSASTVANWLGNYCIGQFFPVMLAGIGGPWTFGIFALLNAVFIVFTLLFIPETKGISLEGIEMNLMGGKPLRKIGV
jgi:SP family galactose:H+ symporter-like MFS transporter